jgi:hypothetical protein
MQARNKYIGQLASPENVATRPSLKTCSSKEAIEPLVRGRGRRALEVPSEKHFEILAATRTQTYEQVGSLFGISRQRVAQIIRRWKQYSPVRTLRSREIGHAKSAPRLRIKKENRIHIVSFRLTDSEVKTLQARYPEMKSADRAARGIVTRFLSL